MPRTDGLKFKQTITDLNFARPPESTHLRPVPPRPQSKIPAASVNQTTIRLPPQTQRMLPQPEASPEPPQLVPAELMPQENETGTAMAPAGWSNTQAMIRTGTSSPTTIVFEQVEIPVNVDARLVMLYGHATEQARAYRLLRHRLLAQNDPRVIAVTSAEPEEGKTTCAANLALALADETMSRVLLIEANLRRPSLGQVFGYEPSDSFVRRLVNHRDASPPYPVAGVLGTRLHIAALPSRRPREMRLNRLLFSTALHELRPLYDYIVIDAASVLESADADVAGECADGVVLVARAELSKKASLARAVEQLRPTRIFGTVVLDT